MGTRGSYAPEHTGGFRFRVNVSLSFRGPGMVQGVVGPLEALKNLLEGNFASIQGLPAVCLAKHAWITPGMWKASMQSLSFWRTFCG